MIEKLYHFPRARPARPPRCGIEESMSWRGCSWLAALLVLAAFLAPDRLLRATATAPPPAQPRGGWQLPPEAPSLKSPLTADENVLAAGKKIFRDKCQKCHGPKGLGDGPDADPEHAEAMNLTNPARAGRNPDGVVFYKVMNGRRNPKMPAFKDELSQEQVWTVVAYVQSLRGR
jgi:mono/diheme cytochrome c family protein